MAVFTSDLPHIHPKPKYQCVSDNDFFWFEVDGVISEIGGNSKFNSYGKFISIFDISKPKQLNLFLELNPLIPEFFKTHQPQGFYMVFVEGERNPVYKHNDINDAMHEAKRLSVLTNKTSYILFAIRQIKINNQFTIKDTIEPKMDELPF